jgi:RHS repeat-associated protein
LYRGEQYDSDLGLYYLRARYYNPLTGRFMSRDPKDSQFADPKSLHKYLYADGDPINGIDPTGSAAYIESVFTRTVISSEVEVSAVNLGRDVIQVLCDAARLLVWALQPVPPGVVPGGAFLKPLPVLCAAIGF